MSDLKSKILPKLWRFDLKTIFLMAFFLLLFLLGIFAFLVEQKYGLLVTGMRTIGLGGSAWGVYIVFDIYFVGISFAGIVTSALIRLFNLKILKPLARMAELLAVISLLISTFCIFADVGRPLHALVYLPLFARPMSPFFGDFTLIAGAYFFASAIYLWLAGRSDAAYCASQNLPFRWFYKIWACGYKGTAAEQTRHYKTSFWMALAILPLLVTAHSTLGFIFGIQGGRPGWFSDLQAPEFVVMAGVSGVGMLIIIAAILRKWLGLEEEIKLEAFKWLGNFLWVLTATYIYFMIIDDLTSFYASPKIDTLVALRTLFGPYGGLYWTTVSSLFAAFGILFLQFAFNKWSIGLTVIAGFLVNVAAILKRFIIIVPSQVFGTLLPYPQGFYKPTWVEISIIIGTGAFGIFLYVLFLKIFPIVPLEEITIEKEKILEPGPRSFFRKLAFSSVFLTGILICVITFLSSARFGTKPYLDPIIPFSPLLFIVGIFITFFSAAVYEIVPSVKKSDL